MEESKAHRGLSTARAALQVTWLLARAPDGVRADAVAAALGKSVSTAYNLLTSLCEEGVAVHSPGGRYRLAPAFRALVAAGGEVHDLSVVVDDLLARTHKRAYLGVARPGHLEVVAERGLQGMPRFPDLDAEVRDNAHALALGKVVLALMRPDALERHLRRGLPRFTPHTITSPDRLRAELRAIRRTGVAVDREEAVEDFCCLAAPILDARGRFLGAVGVSMSRRAFETERPALEETLRDVARFQAYAQSEAVLDPVRHARLASASASPEREEVSA